MAFSYVYDMRGERDTENSGLDTNLPATAKLCIVMLVQQSTDGVLLGQPTLDSDNMTQAGSIIVGEETSIECWYLIAEQTAHQFNFNVPNANTKTFWFFILFVDCATGYIPSLIGYDSDAGDNIASLPLSLTQIQEGDVKLTAVGSGDRDYGASGLQIVWTGSDTSEYNDFGSQVCGGTYLVPTGATNADPTGTNADNKESLTGFVVGFTETATGSNYTETPSDNLGLVDSDIQIFGFGRPISETLGITDSHSILSTYVRSLEESLGLSDDATRIATVVRSVAESLDLTDSLSPSRGLFKTIDNSIGIADSCDKVYGIIRNYNESIGLVDLVSRSLAFNREVLESLGTEDSFVDTELLVRQLLENLGLLDNTTKSLGLNELLSEILGLSDVLSKVTGKGFTVNDNLGLTDLTEKISAITKSLSESLGISDSLGLGVAKQLVENLGISDSIGLALLKNLLDNVGITDSQSLVRVVYRTIDESMGISDILDVIASGSSSKQINNSIGVVDSLERLATYIRLQEDGLGISDEILYSLVYSISINDIEGINDVASKILVVLRTFSDIIGVSDSIVVLNPGGCIALGVKFLCK